MSVHAVIQVLLACRFHLWDGTNISDRLEAAFADFDTWRRRMRISSSITQFDLKKSFKCQSLLGSMHGRTHRKTCMDRAAYMGHENMHGEAFMTWHACEREREKDYSARHAWDSTHRMTRMGKQSWHACENIHGRTSIRSFGSDFQVWQTAPFVTEAGGLAAFWR